MADPAPLKLLAQDAEDLRIVSAALQDAVTKVGDIRWEPAARRVTVEFNRFRWESEGRGRGERVRAALQFGGVLACRSRNLRREARHAVLELLALEFVPGDPPGGLVMFEFAGGGDLRLEVECVDAVLLDVSRPWPTPRKPAHDEAS